MRYFILAEGDMSLHALKDLIQSQTIPELVIARKASDKIFRDRASEICSSHGIELLITDNLEQISSKINEYDLGVSIGYMEIIKEDLFNLPKHGIINIHAGKLPDYKGRAPICRAIMNGDDAVFLTIHKIDAGVDSGDILFERRIEIDENDISHSIYKKAANQSGKLLSEAIKMIESGKAKYAKQQPADIKPHQKLTEKERRIDFSSDVRTILNKVRALAPPYPCAIIKYKGRDLYVSRAELSHRVTAPEHNHGTIVNIEMDNVAVKANDGVIKLIQILDPATGHMIFPEYFMIGERLE